MFSFCRGRFHSATLLPIVSVNGTFVGKEHEMKAQLARFVISLIAMLIALLTFIEMDVGWLSAGLIVIALTSGFSLSEAAFRRLADQETIRRDLEERFRNQHF